MAKDKDVLIWILVGIAIIWAVIVEPFINWFKQNILIASIITIILICVIGYLLKSYLQKKKIDDVGIEVKKKEEIRIQHRKELEGLTEEEQNIILDKLYREQYPQTSIFSRLLDLIKQMEAPRKSTKPARVPIPAETRRKVFQRAGFKCQICAKKVHTEIHHINGDRSNNNPGNLVVLCPTCHAEADTGAIRKEQLTIARDKQASFVGKREYH